MKENKVVFFVKPTKQGERMLFEVPKALRPLVEELSDTCRITVEGSKE